VIWCPKVDKNVVKDNVLKTQTLQDIASSAKSFKHWNENENNVQSAEENYSVS